MTRATLDSTVLDVLERGGRLTQKERDQLAELRNQIDAALAGDRRLATPAMPSPPHRPPNTEGAFREP